MDQRSIPIGQGQSNFFFCGTNVPWINYAEDLVYFPAKSEKRMAEAMEEIRQAGGNAMRWWLHTNGCYSPEVANGKVVGLHKDTIYIIKKVLDMALARGISISMCLWSFDMLQDQQGQDVQAMKDILENPQSTKLYIDNALIPILKAVGTHPAIMTWEIFNEPEGMTDKFGWSGTRTEIKYIQQTINLIAGAIHRFANGVPVSVGAWCMQTMTDVAGFFNYYRDDRLIEAGGDVDGYLDLYQVHYFPENFEISLSPFHNPASHWCLGKPLIVGEFPNRGCDQAEGLLKKDTKECIFYALNNGYAGCMTWRWPFEEGKGSFSAHVFPAIRSFNFR